MILSSVVFIVYTMFSIDKINLFKIYNLCSPQTFHWTTQYYSIIFKYLNFKLFRWIMSGIMSMKYWTTKLQNDTTREQTMSQYLNSFLIRTRIYISGKIISVYEVVLKLIKNLLSTLDLSRNCFQCSRSRLTRKLYRQIGIGESFFIFLSNIILAVNIFWPTICKKLGTFH